MATATKKGHTKRKVVLIATFAGNGRIEALGKGGAFYGSVPEPKIKPDDLSFSVAREYKGRNGLWNPRDSGVAVKGGFQININGSAKGYRQLAEYFLALAEIDSRLDDNFHEHIEGVWDTDKKVRLHLIFRKTYTRKKVSSNYT